MRVRVVLLLGKERFEVEADGDTVVSDVAASVAQQSAGKVPAEAQSIIIKGRKRGDDESISSLLSAAERSKADAETDAEMVVVVKGRIMLKEGFTVAVSTSDQTAADSLEPERPDAKAQAQAQAQEQARDRARRRREAPSVDSLAPGAVLVTVQQGSEQHFVVAPHAQWTVGDVKLHLQSKLAVPVAQQKLLVKGKVRDDAETLADAGMAPPRARAMLLFHDGYHQATDGEEYLVVAEEELGRARAVLAKVEAQLDHRMSDAASLVIDIDVAVDRLENVENGLDRPVRLASAPRKKVVLEGIAALLQRFDTIKKHRVHGAR